MMPWLFDYFFFCNRFRSKKFCKEVYWFIGIKIFYTKEILMELILECRMNCLWQTPRWPSVKELITLMLFHQQVRLPAICLFKFVYQPLCQHFILLVQLTGLINSLRVEIGQKNEHQVITFCWMISTPIVNRALCLKITCSSRCATFERTARILLSTLPASLLELRAAF